MSPPAARASRRPCMSSAPRLTSPTPNRIQDAEEGKNREALIEALAIRMSRARAKGTTLDFELGSPESSSCHGEAERDGLGARLARAAESIRRATGQLLDALSKIGPDRVRAAGRSAPATLNTHDMHAANKSAHREQERSR